MRLPADRPVRPAATPIAEPAADGGCWAFGPPDSEVLVRNAEGLLAHLSVFLAGWPFRRVADGAAPPVAVEVVEQPGGRFAVTIAGPGGGRSAFDNAFDAAGGVAGAVVDAWLARAGLVGLRAAGVRVPAGLLVLLGRPLSGKSSVALQLAASGYRLFGEDRLALRLAPDSGPCGLCLGLTPRVRLPLPPDCGARFAEYVEGFTEMRDADAAWLKLWEGEAAGFAEEAPLAAFAVLERRQSGPCSLAPARGPDIVEALLAGGVSPHLEGEAPAAAFTGLASRIPGYRLRFTSSREAAAVLAAALRDLPAA